MLGALAYADAVTDRDGNTVDLGVSVRVAAVEALSRSDSPLGFEGLVRALDDREESVRVAAVRGLRDRGGPAVLEPLVTVAATWSDSDRALSRAEAIDALISLREGRVPSAVAEELLVRPAEIDASDCAVAARVARAAGDAAVGATIAELMTHLREASAPVRARKLLVALAPESVDPLIDALREDRMRHDATLALGSTGSSRAVEPLSSVLLSDPDPSVRRAAAWALGAIRDPAAVEPLLLATRDGEFQVRSEAIDAFERYGNAGVALAVSAMMGPALEESMSKSSTTLEAAEKEQAPTAEVDAARDSEPAAEAPTEPGTAIPADVEERPDDEVQPADPPAASHPEPRSNGAPPPGPRGRARPGLRRLIDRYLAE